MTDSIWICAIYVRLVCLPGSVCIFVSAHLKHPEDMNEKNKQASKQAKKKQFHGHKIVKVIPIAIPSWFSWCENFISNIQKDSLFALEMCLPIKENNR